MISILGFIGVLSSKIPKKELGKFWGRVGTKFWDFWGYFPPKNLKFWGYPKNPHAGIFFLFAKIMSLKCPWENGLKNIEFNYFLSSYILKGARGNFLSIITVHYGISLPPHFWSLLTFNFCGFGLKLPWFSPSPKIPILSGWGRGYKFWNIRGYFGDRGNSYFGDILAPKFPVLWGRGRG